MLYFSGLVYTEAVGKYFPKTKLLQSELLFNSWSYVGIVGVLLTNLKFCS